MKNIPKYTWLFSLLCLIIPMLPIQQLDILSELMWFLHLIPIYFYTYHAGYKGGFLTLAINVAVLTIWTNHLASDGVPIHFQDVIFMIVFEVATWIGVGYITSLLRNHQFRLEEANERLREKRKKLEEYAYKDFLTGLPNRYALSDHWDQQVTNNDQVAVLFLDLDRFKLINDSLGHDIGDEMLKEAAKRIQNAVREIDVVSRTGGDEFIVLLKESSEEEAKIIAQRILDQFSQPLIVAEHTLYTKMSIGISLYPEHSEEKYTLVRYSDQAMYKAKASGGNSYVVYVPETSCKITRQVQIEQGLHNALKRNQLEVYYQPIVCLKSERIMGVEALIRWHHPTLGMVSPLEFIPVAEESGLISDIGAWTLRQACTQVKTWQNKGLKDLNVAVNVSLRQFRCDAFVDTVKNVLEETGLKPEYLELEITESMMHNIEESQRIMSALKEIGVKLSLDDFGTGYSSLNILSKLPIDLLKIDKSFVRNITNDPTSLAIAKTIIELGSNLNFKLIAEGVEKTEQAQCLLENKSDFAQGFLYSKPVPALELEETLFRINRSAC